MIENEILIKRESLNNFFQKIILKLKVHIYVEGKKKNMIWPVVGTFIPSGPSAVISGKDSRITSWNISSFWNNKNKSSTLIFPKYEVN